MEASFVAITKTGGSAIGQFINKKYPKMRAAGHGHRAKHYQARGKIAIVCLRDPLDRFLSMFYYWKNGSHTWNVRTKKDPQPEIETPSEFIAAALDPKHKHHQKVNALFKEGETYNTFITPLHFEQQSYWLEKANLKKVIVIRYDKKHLNHRMMQVLQFLKKEIPEKGKVKLMNKTKNRPDVYPFTKIELDWIKERYHDDFILWKEVNDPESQKKWLAVF